MKLLNINIGIRMDNIQRVIEYINQIDPDIIAIQEIIRPLENDVFHKFRSKEALDKALQQNYEYSFFGPLWVTDAIRVDNETIVDFGGLAEQGNQVLSKHRITSATNEHYYKTYSYALDWSNWEKEDHGRALQVVEISYKNKTFQILNLHGIWTKDKKGDDRTIKQCEYIVRRAQSENVPTIIAGDFNLVPESDSIKIIDKEFRNLIKEYGIKSTRPDFEDEIDTGRNIVDYIFVNDKVITQGFEVDQVGISDHLPLLLEFGA